MVVCALDIAREEAGHNGVGLGGKGFHRQGPAAVDRQLACTGSDPLAADRASDLQGPVAGMAVHTFIDQDSARRLQTVGGAADLALEATGFHGALLQECGGEASF